MAPVSDIRYQINYSQQTRHYLSTTSVPHIPYSPPTARKNLACYDRVVSLWDIHERRFDGSRKEKEQG